LRVVASDLPLRLLPVLPLPLAPSAALFPYTTLFRSQEHADLEEVVVIGYGAQKKKLTTGANLREEGADLQKRNQISPLQALQGQDRKSTRLNSSHVKISYAVFCLKKKRVPPTDDHMG